MVSPEKLLALTSLAFVVLACGQDTKPITQLVLVADTDIQALDDVEFVISSDLQGSRTADAKRTDKTTPSYLSLVHDQGPLGPVTVSARGLTNGNVVVERTQQVFFVQDETRVVPLHLFSSCVGVVCAADLTCSERGCTTQTLTGDELPTWTGKPPHAPHVDATSDAGTGVDAGTDAGVEPMDGGSDAGDAGRMHRGDASLDARIVEDAQLPDADAAADGGDAALGDASADASTDAGDAALTRFLQCDPLPAPAIDVDSNMANCGMCKHPCKVMEVCVVGSCVKK